MSSSIRFWQVDAFTDRPFGGNPAAVCWLDEERDAAWMQNVAAEMNLSDTAFVRRLGDEYELRWFTPAVEVDLCGHATLATAHALWSAGLAPAGKPLRFRTRSGCLTCLQNGPLIEMDFPATPAAPAHAPDGLAEALGIRPVSVGKSPFDYLVVCESAGIVRESRPDFALLAKIPARGVIVTARSDEAQFDFVSRFFGPAFGINEDPATGSAHCCLGPYWAEQLGRSELRACQVSARRGVLRVRCAEDRVILGGQAVTVLQGEIL